MYNGQIDPKMYQEIMQRSLEMLRDPRARRAQSAVGGQPPPNPPPMPVEGAAGLATPQRAPQMAPQPAPMQAPQMAPTQPAPAQPVPGLDALNSMVARETGVQMTPEEVARFQSRFR